jgi:SAM-dependent methyltransferase
MQDWNGYIKRMSYTMNDKLFFVEQLNIHEYDAILDFGCANGELLRNLAAEYGYSGHLVGYDISPEMIKSAVILSSVYNNITFSRNFDLILEFLKPYHKILVNFSSVWHEIDSSMYREILNAILPVADTITIRDMYHQQGYIGDYNRKLTEVQLENIKNNVSEALLSSYEEKWGKIEYDDWNLYQFFLKYTYVDNWETENEEFYFGTPWEYIFTRAKWQKFSTKYDLRYTLPYKKEQVKKDFGFYLNKYTHRNLILTKDQR